MGQNLRVVEKGKTVRIPGLSKSKDLSLSRKFSSKGSIILDSKGGKYYQFDKF